ncbi:hypothetical protein B9Z45_16065 [Limnohabitans sp. 2KL-17]|uniref:hypothetical protein n=1 Tax=Limnohabitans sp. 2KL-17 TaxID=1100704 RepID=UPI000D3622FA|nr:hypothetical protein [Limnohabitans sp. 2KL-17]PUE48512.1 hypothetical protein B9Z45_16065 [Limnohabitans sp. 2KL-17]
MNTLSMNAAQIASAIASETVTSVRTDSSKAYIEAGVSATPFLSLTQPMNQLAVSAEELTFQFSEVAEAKETALEERLARQEQVKEKIGALKVEQIQTIMKLMEGKEGYDILRGQARSFAALYQENPEGALKQIDLGSISAEKKYALLNMALNTLAVNNNHPGAQVSLARHIQEQHNPFQRKDQLQIASLATTASTPSPKQEDKLFQAISIQPSIKGIWELLNEKSSGNLLEAIQKTRLAWNEPHSSFLENVGAVVIIHKIMSVIQSMHANAEQIMVRIGVQDIWKNDRLQKHTKMLIDLAQSNMPSTLIDKVFDSLRTSKRQCPRCTLKYRMECKNCHGDATVCNCTMDIICRCPDFREHVLSLLHWHVRQWPTEVWTNNEAKNLVLDQLLKKQNAPNGLLAKRMMR